MRRGDRIAGVGRPLAPGEPAMALPALAALAVCLVWAVGSGGALPRHLFAGGLALLGLLLVSALAARPSPPPRLTLAAVAALAGYAAWSYASIGWADVPGDAWTGASRTAVYAAVFALFSLRAWRPPAAAGLLGALALGIGVVGLLVVLGLGRADAPGDAFVAGRLDAPIGYPNASAALFLLGFWPAFLLASRSEAPWPVRALMLGIAGGLAELAILPQSRGAVIAFAVGAAAYLIAVPGRLRTLVTAAPLAVVLALAAPALLGVFDAAGGPRFEPAVEEAVRVVGRSFLVLVAAGALLAALDRVVAVPRLPAPPRGAAAALAGIALALVLGLALAFDAAARVDRAWDDFTSTPTAAGEGARLVGGLGGNRYDLWRVAAGEFLEHPALGVGADNYAVAYVRERRTDDEPRYPHSLPLQALSQTGVVGGALLAAFLLAAGAAAWRSARRAGPFGRAVVAVAGVTALAWLAQASIDWFWELPALTAPALAALAVAGRVGDPDDGAGRARAWPALVAVGALAAVAAIVPLWLAERHIARATAVWRDEPARAYGHLGRAAGLDPLGDRPLLIEGAIASRRADWARMERAFREALERNPSGWYAELELAVALALQGRREEAMRHLRAAELLNPREPAVQVVRERIRAGQEIDPAELDRMFLERVDLRTR